MVICIYILYNSYGILYLWGFIDRIYSYNTILTSLMFTLSYIILETYVDRIELLNESKINE